MSDKINLDKVNNITELPHNIRPKNVNVPKILEHHQLALDASGYESVYHAFFEITDLACLSLSNGQILKINKRFTQILGYSKQEMIGKTVLEFIHPSDIEPTINAQNKVFQEGELNNFENRWRRKTGEYIRLEWCATHIGDVYYSMAREKNEINEYLSRVTHELRTPMNSIIGFAQILNENRNLAGTDKQAIECIMTAANSLQGLIDDIIDLSQVHNSGFNLVDLNLDVFFKDHFTQYLALLRTDDIKLEYHHSCFDCCIQIEVNKFDQIMRNLISNAIKYNKAGGKISVKGHINNKTIEIEILDTGHGISPEFQKKLFVPFEREYPEIPGTGLGLSIAKKQIEMFGGEIDVRSVINDGTVFTLKFPITSITNNSKFSPEITTFNHASSKLKIVNIDDNDMNQLLMSIQITRMFPNHEYIAYRSGQEFIDNIQHIKPDILLLDYHLHDLNANALYPRIRDKLAPETITCLISADSTIGKMEQIRKLGIKHYLVKPVNFTILKQIINTHIKLHK